MCTASWAAPVFRSAGTTNPPHKKIEYFIPMKKIPSLIFLALCFATTPIVASGASISLAGEWRFELDRSDAGIANQWFSRDLPNKLKLPGTLAGQGIGDDISTNTPWIGGVVDRSWFSAPEYAKYRAEGNVKVPFWLQPDKYFKGAAWYQRDIDIPWNWSNQRVVLTLERPHWETRVWVDSKFSGSNNALATPHEYDLGHLSPGKHRLTIRVDNRMIVDIGQDSHSVSDHTQGNWNGIAGRLELQPRSDLWIDDVQVFPDAARKSIRVVINATNATAKSFAGKLHLDVERDGKPICLGISRNFNTAEPSFNTTDEIELGPEAPLWDEFNPAVLTLRTELRGELGGAAVASAIQTTFGLRTVATEGTQITLNGRKTFIRGTLECAIFPKTGHPPTDVASWRKVIMAAKAHGLNLLRFHSWCPPEAAFQAADELGMYFHVECSSWANSSTSLGDGKPVDRWIYEEADRILKAYGNHPSFVLMLYGNEPGGKNHSKYLAEWVEHYKSRDSRRLYSSGAGWPQIAENQFHVTPDPRVQSWGGGLKSRINGRSPETTTDYRDYISRRKVPVISHEIGQWCVYPNFEEVKKYTGYLKPRNFEIFRDTLREHHMEDLAPKFLYASGKLQTVCYKEDIESALRTPGMGGFELLDLHDFPGQGTALVGVLDPFWESKGYVTAAEYSRFCNSTVPLARLSKRVFTTDESLEAAIEVAHFGPAPLKNATTTWKLLNDSGSAVADGAFDKRDIPIGNGLSLGKIAVPLARVPAPARYKLTIAISDSVPSTATFQNDWDLWAYPNPQSAIRNPQSKVRVIHDLIPAAITDLQSGAPTLLLIPPSRVAPDRKLGKVALGFSSIFWNTAWTRRQPPHTLGILCDSTHPLFAQFPTDYHSNWQWWYLVSQAGAMILDDLPSKLRPTVQVIDDWVTARRLGLAFEAKIGRGKLMVCSIDLEHGLETNVVARQFRESLFHYMDGPKFDPKIEVGPEQICALFAPPSTMSSLGAQVLTVDSEQPGYEAANLLDGDESSIWHTRWTATKAPYPHQFQIAFQNSAELTAFRLLPRQDNNRNGWIKDFAIELSPDGTNWTEVARGSFARDASRKTVSLSGPVRARFVKMLALSGFDSQSFASLAEFEVVTK